MASVRQDVRFAIRLLKRNRTVGLGALITIALAVAATTSIFTVVNSVLLKPLPYPDADRIVHIGSEWIGFQHSSVSIPEYLDYAGQNTVFDSIAAYSGTNANLTGRDGIAERIRGARVTASFFSVLKVQPEAGNFFTAADEKDTSSRKVVISFELSKRYFAGESGIGSRIRLDNEFYTVEGIAERGFSFPDRNTDFWIPLNVSPNANRGAHNREVIARLKTDARLAAARDQMNVIASRLQQQYPEHYPAGSGWGVSIFPLKELLVGDVKTGLRFLMVAVGFVLLIACANVANLLLVQSAAREKEMAIRIALGAGKARIIHQVLVESFVLAITGGLFGLFFAFALIRIVPQIDPAYLPRLDEIRPDFAMFAFSAGISVLAGFCFGIVPALLFANEKWKDSLSGGQRSTESASGNRIKKTFATLEIALATVVLSSAILLFFSFLRLTQVQPGFDPDRVITSRISLSDGKYPEDQDIRQFYAAMLERLRSSAGVEHAATVSHLPLSGDTNDIAFGVEGFVSPVPDLEAYEQARVVSPSYFSTMRIPLLKGRDFAESDTMDRPGVVIISESVAKKYLSGQEPVGKRIRLGGVRSDFPWITIVGVVGDIKHTGLDQESKPTIYFPFHQRPEREMTIVARMKTTRESALSIVPDVVRQIDRDQPVYQNQWMERYISDSTAHTRLNLFVLMFFALLSAALACLGIYAVIAFSVSRRVREFGVRLALGEQPLGLLKLVLRESSILIGVGLFIGIASALVAGRLLSGLIFGIQPSDPQALLLVTILLGALALVACFPAALRASRIDPAQSLKSE